MDGPDELTVSSRGCCKVGAQHRRPLLVAGETRENVMVEEAFNGSQNKLGF